MDSGDIQVVKVLDPFSRERDAFTEPFAGKTMQELCGKLTEKHSVFINDIQIEPQFWTSCIPQKGDIITVIPKVGDPWTIGALVAKWIFGTAVSGYATAGGAFWAGVGKTAVAVIAAGAYAYGMSVLISSLFAPDRPDKGAFEGAEPGFAWSYDPRNMQEEGIVVQRFYGKNKLFGNVIACHTIPDATDETNQLLDVLISLGEGPVEGIVADSIRINGQPIGNYLDISTEEKYGTSDQTCVSFFDTLKTEYRPNMLVRNDTGAETYTTVGNDFDVLEIELFYPRGIAYLNGLGSWMNTIVKYKIEISEIGANTWSTLADDEFQENTRGKPIYKRFLNTATYTGGAAVTITRGTRYDIKIAKTQADRTEDAYADELRLGAVREVQDTSFIYPYTALLGVEAMATDQLSGSFQASCIQEGRIVYMWNGSAWVLEYSNNPAWILLDIIIQPVISGDGESATPYVVERYEGMNPSYIDTTKFYELAQHCDDLVDDGEGGTEKRITFNGGFDTGTNPWDAALEVCRVARCSPIWNGSILSLAIDKASDPVALFGVGNVIEGSYKQTFLSLDDRASEIEVQYLDAAQDYKRTSFTVYDSNTDLPNNKVTIQLKGVSKQSEAWRAAWLRLMENRLLKSIISFKADIDAVAIQIGDRIYFQHDIPDWEYSGNIVSSSTTDIIVDRDLVYGNGDTYSLLVRQQDDALNDRTVTSQWNDIIDVDSTLKTFTVDGDWTDEYKDGDEIKVSVNQSVESVSYEPEWDYDKWNEGVWHGW